MQHLKPDIPEGEFKRSGKRELIIFSSPPVFIGLLIAIPYFRCNEEPVDFLPNSVQNSRILGDNDSILPE